MAGHHRFGGGRHPDAPGADNALPDEELLSGPWRPVLLEQHRLTEEDPMKTWLIALTALALLSLVCVPLTLAAGHEKTRGKPQPGVAKAHVKFKCEATVFSATPAGRWRSL
jgi:hypothetical protein